MLFTGATGFIGRNILPLLRHEYMHVATLGKTSGNDIIADLSNAAPTLPQRYEIVVHAAGKAHFTPTSKEDEQLFYSVNFDGTRNLCRALENVGVPKALIFISSVAVYGCDSGHMIDETHPLNGTSPYAKSKIQAEKYLTEWCQRNNVTLSILRPSLIAGVNPPGNLGAMIHGIERGRYFNIAGGIALKSIVMCDDIAEVITKVKDHGGVYNICSNEAVTFAQLSKHIAGQLCKPTPLSIPYFVARAAAFVGDIIGHNFPLNSARLDKLCSDLTFSNARAVTSLNWRPKNILDSFHIR